MTRPLTENEGIAAACIPTSEDVLSGRGGRINMHLGNSKFRNLINASLPRFNEVCSFRTSKNRKKHQIAQDIYDIVESQGGRFLKKIAPLEEWTVSPKNEAFRKIKQALRDLRDRKQKAQKEHENYAQQSSKLPIEYTHYHFTITVLIITKNKTPQQT